jgi:hypothetical protein
VAQASVPDYTLGTHDVPLGRAFAQGSRPGERFVAGFS